MARRLSCIVVLCLTALGCASLDGLRALIQPPRFEQADGADGRDDGAEAATALVTVFEVAHG